MGMNAMPSSAQLTTEFVVAWKFVVEVIPDIEYWACAVPVPELSSLRVKPIPAMAFPPKLFVPMIPSRKELA